MASVNGGQKFPIFGVLKSPDIPRLYQIPDERPAGYGEGAEMRFWTIYEVISEGDFLDFSRNPAPRF